jgi:hypothetical protein
MSGVSDFDRPTENDFGRNRSSPRPDRAGVPTDGVGLSKLVPVVVRRRVPARAEACDSYRGGGDIVA